MIEGVSGVRYSSPGTDRQAESDAQLVRAAQGGDRAAFVLLVKRHQNAVSAVAFALTGRVALSEDIAQETFVVAWRRLVEIQEPERFRGWLLGVARKKSLLALRDQRTRAGEPGFSLLADRVEASDPSPLERAISREEEHLVWRALRQIPAIYRTALVLFYREQSSIQEVARTLDVSEEVVKKRLSRGRRLVHRHLAAWVESVLVKTRPDKKLTLAIVAALESGAKPVEAGNRASVPANTIFRIGWTIFGTALALVVTAAPLVAPKADLHGGEASLDGLPRASLRPHLPPQFQLAALQSPAAPPVSAGTAAVGRRRHLALDFEDGLFPNSGVFGEITSGPGLARGRYSLTAQPDPEGGGKFLMFVLFPRDPVPFADALMIGFDYWVAKETRLTIQISSSGNRTHIWYITPAALGTWTHVDVPLRNVVPDIGQLPMEAGDAIVRIAFVALNGPGQTFRIDDITVYEP